MEFLTSLTNQIINRGIINQTHLKSIHSALLSCLENTAQEVGREDYHPGEINLTQWFHNYSSIIVLRLIVGRNGVDIFSSDSLSPELKILRQLSGNYILLDGLEYDKNGRIIHKNCGMLPLILASFSTIDINGPRRQDNIIITRIS